MPPPLHSVEAAPRGPRARGAWLRPATRGGGHLWGSAVPTALRGRGVVPAAALKFAARSNPSARYPRSPWEPLPPPPRILRRSVLPGKRGRSRGSGSRAGPRGPAGCSPPPRALHNSASAFPTRLPSSWGGVVSNPTVSPNDFCSSRSQIIPDARPSPKASKKLPYPKPLPAWVKPPFPRTREPETALVSHGTVWCWLGALFSPNTTTASRHNCDTLPRPPESWQGFVSLQDPDPSSAG